MHVPAPSNALVNMPPVYVPAPANVPVPPASSPQTPVNPLAQSPSGAPAMDASDATNVPNASTTAAGASSAAWGTSSATSGTSSPPAGVSDATAHTDVAATAGNATGPLSQPPTTLVHPLGGSSHPPSAVSVPPRPSYAPQTVPSGTPASLESRVRELQAQVVRARQELVSAQVELRTARGEADNLRAELSVARGRIEELEAGLVQAKSAAMTRPGDDLKVIKGIGPKFEKLLRGAGVTSVAQIATWSESDIDAIAQAIGIRPERIRKDDWVGKAKLFAAGTA